MPEGLSSEDFIHDYWRVCLSPDRMALPANDPDPSRVGTQPTPQSNKPHLFPKPTTSRTTPTSGDTLSFRSYTQATKGLLTSSLQELSNRSVLASTPTHAAVSHADTPHYLLRRGAEEFIVFYDVTGTKVSPKAFYAAAREVFPVGVGLGILTHRDNDRILVEIILDSEASCEAACACALVIGENTRFQATRSLPPDHKVTKVRLEKLPLLPKSALEEGLRKCLSRYGHIIQIGLYEEPKGGWFLGRGFAVLSSHPAEQFAQLTHRLHWGDITGTDRSFFAYWDTMGLHCRYCHETTHALVDCPVRPSRRCFNFQRMGHFASNCPHPPNTLAHKRPKRNINDSPATAERSRSSPIQKASNVSVSSSTPDI